MRRALTVLVAAAALSLVAGPATAERADTRLLGRITSSVDDAGVVSTSVAFRCPEGATYRVYVSAEQSRDGLLPDGSPDFSTGDNINFDNDGDADATFTTGTCTGSRQRRAATFEDEGNPFREGPAAFTVEVASFVGEDRTEGVGFQGTLTIR